MRTFGRRRGFSLIELVFVIGIIGFLAGVAIPRMSSVAGRAGGAALHGDLRVVRCAILLYAAEHGQFPGPDSTDLVDQLTRFTNANGDVSATRGGAYILGPYLRAIPPCPIPPNYGSTSVLIDPANSPPLVDPDTGDGWVYNPLTGEFLVNAEKLPDGATQPKKAGAALEGTEAVALGP